MLVSDDEATVATSLRSILDLVTYWIVCDTGSVDRTVEIVTEVMHTVPGELHRRPWRDFGWNRSELMELAYGKADYLLLLDPDMTLVRSEDLGELGDDVYRVRESGDAVGLGVPRLINGRRRWSYQGSTHEVLVTNGRYSESPLDTMVVERLGGDRQRERSLLRQLDILEREVADDGESPWTVLCLAETLRDLGRGSAAIEWFRRLKGLGDDEVAFYAHLQEGVLRAKEDFGSAVPVLLEAWQRRPTRAEPLYELARNYRERGEGWLAYHFADRGLQIEAPADTLHVQRWIYTWGLRFERGWAAGWLGRIEDAKEDLRIVLETDGVPPDFVEVVGHWLEHLGGSGAVALEAAPKPVSLASVVNELRFGTVVLDVSPSWPIFNPSIAADGAGFALLVRSLNVVYDIGELLFVDKEPRNINYLVDLDPSLGVSGVNRLHDTPSDFKPREAQIHGFEDLRLIQLHKRWYAIADSWELSGSDVSEMALLELDGATVTRVHHLLGPNRGRQEKNWMPFIHNDALHCIYSCAPTVIFRIDHRTGTVSLVAESEAPELATSFRGGSQGVPLGDGGYLFVVHETYQEAGMRSYLHRFIRIGPDLRLQAVSPPFTFTGERREFCAGAAVQGSDLVLSFGIRHTEAWLAVVPLAKALDLLQAVVTDSSPSQRSSRG